MNKKIYFVLLLFVFFVFGAFKRHHFVTVNEIKPLESIQVIEPVNRVSEIQEVIDNYDDWLTGELNSSGTVGAAVAIVYKNHIAFTKCFGVRKAGTKDSIDTHTVFRLASVSKTVTGVLAGILEDEKIISFDDKVVNYIPGFQLKNHSYTKSLTIRNLLSHTSGVVPHAYDDLVEHHVPIKKIIGRFNAAGVTALPGQLYGYQNVMFSLIDTILRAKTLKSYSDLVKEKLFLPYGMYDASTDFQTFQHNKNIAYPHTAIAKNRFRALHLNDRYYSTAPAAGVNASISDMSNFLLALLNNNDHTINENVHQAVFTPQVTSPLNHRYFRFWDHVDSKQYAIGWRIVGYKGRQVAYHGGYVNGYKAEIAYCKDDDIGIVYLSNSPNAVASQTVPEFLNLLFEFNDNKLILTGTKVDNPENSENHS